MSFVVRSVRTVVVEESIALPARLSGGAESHFPRCKLPVRLNERTLVPFVSVQAILRSAGQGSDSAKVNSATPPLVERDDEKFRGKPTPNGFQKAL